MPHTLHNSRDESHQFASLGLVLSTGIEEKVAQIHDHISSVHFRLSHRPYSRCVVCLGIMP